MRFTHNLLVVLFLVSFAQAQEPSRAEKLIQALGNDLPAIREKAALELRALGKAALTELEAGLKSDDAEVRRVCADLVEAIRTDRGPLVEAFLNGEMPKGLPLPGWEAFKKAGGDDRVARFNYYELTRSSPELIEQLEKHPKKLAEQTQELCQGIWNRQGGGNKQRTAQILEALMAAALEPSLDDNKFSSYSSMMYQQDVQQLIRENAVARRLVTSVLNAQKITDINRLTQVGYLANNLGMTDFLEGTIKPATLKLVEGLSTESPDGNQLQQLISLASITRLTPSLRTKLVPIVRKVAEQAAKSIESGEGIKNPSLIYQASNACQSLGLTEIQDQVLKPAMRSLILKFSEKPEDLNQFYQTINYARVMRMDAELNALIQPTVSRIILEIAEKPADDNRFNLAHSMAQQLNMTEAIEGVLKPAARRRIIAQLEQATDVNRMTQAIYQARNLALNDLMEDTLKPVFTRQAKALLEKPDFNQIQQCYYLAQTMGGNLQQEVIKPAFVKHLKTQATGELNDSAVQQSLAMARQMGCTEDAMPLARRAALDKKVTSYARGYAILTLIEFGSDDDRKALEPLLTDTTSVGNMTINRTTLNTQVRDVVLGGKIARSGKALGDFGFPYFKAIPQLRPFDAGPHSLGFSSEEERTAAFKKWEAVQAEIKKMETP